MRGDPYDHLLNHMVPFHNHFRHAHARLMQAVPTSQTTSRFNLLSIFQQSLQLCHALEMHHSIEEAYIFPTLAKRMPVFGTEDPVHILEHQAMHAKLELLDQYSQKTMRELQSSVGKRYEAEGCGKVVEKKEAQDNADDDEGEKIKPWPTSIYDAELFETKLRDLATTLFPHLDAEEKSLRGSNLKEHGFTLQELSRCLV